MNKEHAKSPRDMVNRSESSDQSWSLAWDHSERDSTSSADTSRLAEILDDYLDALERGAPLDRQSLLTANPTIAEELADSFAKLDMLHAAADGLQEDRIDLPLDSIVTGSPEQLGDFVLMREIGRGGMGVVYEAEQVSLGRSVALKVLPLSSLLHESRIARFKNESAAAASLQHPHIVPVYAVGCDAGLHYYAMQLIEGGSLAELIAERQQEKSPTANLHDADQDTVRNAVASTLASSNGEEFHRAVTELGVQVADALHYAHQQGVIHRDIKPANLLLDVEGKVHVADFGLARVATADGLTVTGGQVGTLRYMSQEQITGEGVDHRSDIYSLGLTLYELLSGRPAYQDDSRAALLKGIREKAPPHLTRLSASVPADLATVIHTAMSTDVDDRYASAADFADDLRAVLEHRSIKAKPATAFDRLRRFARRNKALTATLATVFLLTALLAVFSTTFAINSRKQARLQRIGLYAANMRDAKTLVEERRLLELQELLLKWRPQNGEEDLRGFEWWHLWRYCTDASIVHSFEHDFPCFNVEFIDNETLVSTGFPSRAKIWSLRDGERDEPREFLNGNATGGRGIAYAEKHNWVVTSNVSGRIHIWDGQNWETDRHIPRGKSTPIVKEYDLDLGGGARDDAWRVSLSEDEQQILVSGGCNEGGFAQLIDIQSDKTLFQSTNADFCAAVFGSEDQLVISNGTDKTLDIIDPDSGETTRVIPIGASVNRMVASPDRRFVAVGGRRQPGTHVDTWRVELIDIEQGSRFWSCDVANAPDSLCFSSDGKTLYWGDTGGAVWVVDCNLKQKKASVRFHQRIHTGDIEGIAVSPDGSRLATAGSDSRVVVWDVDKLLGNQRPVTRHQGESQGCFCCCFADNEGTIAATSRANGTFVWHPSDANNKQWISEAADEYNMLQIASAPKKRVVASTLGYWPIPDNAKSPIMVRDLEKNESWSIDLPALGASFTSAAMTPDGRFLAVCTHRHGLVIVDIAKREIVETLYDVPAKTIRSSTDGKLFAVGGADGSSRYPNSRSSKNPFAWTVIRTAVWWTASTSRQTVVESQP